MTVYERIRRAAIRGTGCRLTADECAALYYGDTAIKTTADNHAMGILFDAPMPPAPPSPSPSATAPTAPAPTPNSG